MGSRKPLNTHPITSKEATEWLDNEAENLHHGIDRRARSITGKTENDQIIERDLMREDVRTIALIDYLLQRTKWQPMDKAPADEFILLKFESGYKTIGKSVPAATGLPTTVMAHGKPVMFVDQDGRALAHMIGWMAVPE